MLKRVYLEITNVCNLACSFCPGTKRPKRFMSPAEFRTLASRLAGPTEYLYFLVRGEPLLHPLLPRFFQMAAQAGFRPMLTTNGTLLDRMGDSILLPGLHKVNISLHSFEGEEKAAHEAYIQKVAAFAEKANEQGIIISLRLWNKDCDEGRNETAVTALQKHLPGDWTENTRGYRIRDKLFLEWGDRFDWPDQNAPEGGDSLYCHGLQDHFGILSDGTVVPCCLDSEGVIALGNVFREALSDILASPRAKAIEEGFRRRKAKEDLCRRCGYARKF